MAEETVSYVKKLKYALDPRRSLRARLALTFGLLVILLTIGLILRLEFTAVNETTDPAVLILELEQQIWISGVLLAIVFVSSAWLMAGRIVHPLHIIAEVAREQLDNGWEHVIPTFPGRDEVASLSRSLNILVARLKTNEKALQEANKSLERLVSERTRQLATLYDVLAISSDTDALPALLDRALERIVHESQAEAGSVHLVEPDGTNLAIISQYQMSQPLLAAYANIPIEQPIVQKTLQQKNYLLLDVDQVSAYDPGWSELMNYHLSLYLPIRSSRHDLGILTVFTIEKKSFTDEEMTLLSSLADQLGILVENERLRRQSERLAVVEERNRLARELHDSVTQALYSAILFAEAGKKQAQAGNIEKSFAYLEDVLQSNRQALKEMRLLLHKLRPSSLEQEGLLQALDQRLKAVEERAGVQPKLVVSGQKSFPAEIEDALYHIAVEALNNALKHTHATAVCVTVAGTVSAVTLQVADNGQGFEPATAVSSGGLGLTSMQERAALLHGTVTIDSSPAGTTVTAVLPIGQKESIKVAKNE